MTEQPPRRPSKGERTRSRIVDAATDLFSSFGFRAVSLRDIAAHAGLTHAGLLHHFPGKESLLIKVLGRRDRVDAKLLFPPGTQPRPDELIDNFARIVARNMRTAGLVSLYVKVSGEAVDPEHPAHDYFVQRYRVLRERLTEAFAELFAQSDPPVDEDPAIAARQLLGLMDGLQTQWLLEPDAVDMYTCVAAFLRRLGITVSASPQLAGQYGDTPADDSDPAASSVTDLQGTA